MAVIAKVAGSGNLVQIGVHIVGQLHTENLECGEIIKMGDACYLAADKKIYRSFATAPGTAASDVVLFFAMSDYDAGELGEFLEGPFRAGYAAVGAKNPGSRVYLAVSSGAGTLLDPFLRGRLSDTPAYTGQPALGYVYHDGGRIHFFGPANHVVA